MGSATHTQMDGCRRGISELYLQLFFKLIIVSNCLKNNNKIVSMNKERRTFLQQITQKLIVKFDKIPTW